MAQFSRYGSAERSARSVFVGNIGYDVTEEQIRQVFNKVGNVVSFRLVHDRDTGKSKGFGFCEFNEPAAAENAIRNYNGYELAGRPLRVDSAAASDRGGGGFNNMDDMPPMASNQAAKDGAPPVDESPYGKEPEPGKAPEAIARVVAAIPPEQMFRLMQEMKQTVTSDPAQTRNLLMENPQLAYALLQAQVVMRLIDPKVAYSMLHRETPAVQHPFHQPMAQQAPLYAPVGGGNMPQPPHHMPPVATQPPFVSQQPSMAPPPATLAPLQQPHMMQPPQQQPSPQQPPSQQQPQPSAAASKADEQATQTEMLIKVINLTDEQVALLPPDDRAKVLELRTQLRHHVTANPTS